MKRLPDSSNGLTPLLNALEDLSSFGNRLHRLSGVEGRLVEVASLYDDLPAAATPVKGLPPESVVPSAHESTQPTSPGYIPPDTVIVPAGGGGGGTVTEAMKVCVNGPEPLAIE